MISKAEVNSSIDDADGDDDDDCSIHFAARKMRTHPRGHLKPSVWAFRFFVVRDHYDDDDYYVF